jgi:hypothetical protein
MDGQVHLNVPPEAHTAKLLNRHRRWGVYYRSLTGNVEGRVEFRQIDPEALSADDVDPTDTTAVVAHVEQQLQEAGYDTTRRPSEGEPVAATWDIRPRDHTPPVLTVVPASRVPAVLPVPAVPPKSAPATESTGGFGLSGAGLRPPRQDRR